MTCTKKWHSYQESSVKVHKTCSEAYQYLQELKKQYGKHTPRCLQSDIDHFTPCDVCVNWYKQPS